MDTLLRGRAASNAQRDPTLPRHCNVQPRVATDRTAAEFKVGKPVTAETMRYWIVKGKPSENDLNKMLKPGLVQPWRTGKPPKLWSPGDRVFFWSSAPRLELIGVGELIGPTGRKTVRGETLYRVRYLTGPMPVPVARDELRADPTCGTANFLKPAVAQGILELTEAQAHEMYRKLQRANKSALKCWPDVPSKIVPAIIPDAVSLPQTSIDAGQGMGTSVANAEVEKAAVAAVSAHFQKLGWTIRSVEQDRCGYDLEARRGSKWKYIEVKGISGKDCAFLLTAGELAFTQRDPSACIIAVTSALTSPQLHEISSQELQERFRVDAIAYRVVPITRG